MFYVNEIPALLIQEGPLVLAVTQINCDQVLEGYSANAVTCEVPPGFQKLEDHRNNYLKRGSSMMGVYLSFDPVSRFWLRRPPPCDSVVRVLCRSTLESFLPLGSPPFKGYRSYSAGTNYFLNWTEAALSVKGDSVVGLVTSAGT